MTTPSRAPRAGGTPSAYPGGAYPGVGTHTPSASTSGGPGLGAGLGGLGAGLGHDLASSSASSSQMGLGTAPSRADQIVYRFYLKTVGVLVDARMTHFGAQKGEHKKDRWFNLTIPDTEVHKADLHIYRSVSLFPPLNTAPVGDGASLATIPPLLIAFILDTNDIPAGQTLMWHRGGARLALDPALARPAGPGSKRPGIVLERWTFRVTDPAPVVGSEMAPPTAYRLGIIHFRALYAFIRLLPAYRLFRRLRRQNTGLRMGIKLWGPEGFPNSSTGLTEAWSVMERDLVGIDVPLERMVPGATHDGAPAAAETSLAAVESYDFAPLELFGNTYELGVVYRPQVDFEVEDKESVLSERFVDMDEDWFTPTVARRRLESASGASASATPGASSNTSRTPSRAGIVPSSSPRQPSSLRYGSTPSQPSSLGAAKWGQLAEGLPFAVGSSTDQQPSPGGGSGSPAGMTGPIPYRRLSAHSLQPFRSISASPSTSILRQAGTPTPGTPPPLSAAARAIPGIASSAGRTSSFLSASGRSFTHAQMAMYGASASPPVTGPLGGLGASPPAPPFAQPYTPPPSSLSFSKQAVSRPMTYSTSSPFVASSLDRDTVSHSHSPHSPGVGPKRLPSSLSNRRLGGSPELGAGVPVGAYALARRSSQRESGLRHSIDEPNPPALQEAPDKDDVHAFLRALDSWTPPPSLAPAHSTARSSSGPAAPSALGSSAAGTGPGASGTSSGGASGPSPSITGSAGRVPLTRQQVDDMLKRMVGSFARDDPAVRPPSEPVSAGTRSPPSRMSGIPSRMSSRPMSRHDSTVSEHSAAGTGTGTSHNNGSSGNGNGNGNTSSAPRSGPASAPRSSSGSVPRSKGICVGGLGLLTASRPSRPGASFPRTSTAPVSVSGAAEAALATGLGLGAARSLPGPQPAPDPSLALSPQTTGSTLAGAARRGPVLVRGGFGPRASTTGSSPSHSPIRHREYALRDRDVSAPPTMSHLAGLHGPLAGGYRRPRGSADDASGSEPEGMVARLWDGRVGRREGREKGDGREGVEKEGKDGKDKEGSEKQEGQGEDKHGSDKEQDTAKETDRDTKDGEDAER